MPHVLPEDQLARRPAARHELIVLAYRVHEIGINHARDAPDLKEVKSGDIGEPSAPRQSGHTDKDSRAHGAAVHLQNAVKLELHGTKSSDNQSANAVGW